MEKIDQYIRSQKTQLGSEVSKKRLIYLDVNYWIFLRKCLMKEDIDTVYYGFYNTLLDLVKKNEVLCPINHSVFTELLKQDDLESRINTAKVIDQFSNSVTLVFEFEREELEIQYFVLQKLLGDKYLIPVEQNVWVKIPYIMGLGHFFNDKIDGATQEKMQIEFFNHSWNITLEEMMRNYIRDAVAPFLDMSKRASKLNDGKFANSSDLKSIKSLFKIELEGVLSVYIELVQRYFNLLTKNRPEILDSLSGKYSINNPKELCDKIEEEILNDEIGNYLPDIYINSCIHTLMRWDKTRQFKANDIYDFEHGRAALPYYQYFFTEGPLKHMLSMKPYELSKKYDCVVENDIKSINELLRSMAS
ncbi:MAG: hypothetical protein K9J12_15805 [Melioribacteraceae bacterium]|nr:hypothetical protein [Melioribacteraceae bacterium]MCF8263692.1 hypothetical protein [Melioribacteraceae bacterium]